MNSQRNSRQQLVLNALPLGFDRRATLRVGRLPFEGRNELNALRDRLAGTHVIRRRGAHIEVVALREDAENVGEVSDVASGDVTNLVSALLNEWLVEHLAGLGRPLFRRRRALVLVSEKKEDDLLTGIVPRGLSVPKGIQYRAAYKLEVRVERPQDRPDVFLTINTTTHPIIDVSVADLIALGFAVDGLYVRRMVKDGDQRLGLQGRLTGRVKRVTGDLLQLEDHDKGWETIPAADAKLEPRIEVLAQVLAGLQGARGDAVRVLEQLRSAASSVAVGVERMRRVREMATYLRRQHPTVAPGLKCDFGKLLTTSRRFPSYEVATKPSLIFDPGGRHSDRWNQRGLDQHGPYDKFQFNPKQLNIAVVCQADFQGRVEPFVDQLLHGVPNTRGGDVGFLRRFALEKPYIRMFQATSASPSEYRAAAVRAVEHITDQGKQWDLVLVQIESAMEDLIGDANPYLVTKAFFLSKGIAVQHFHYETTQQADQQRAYSLNNIGLACYAKLGGIPWLLPTDHKVADELVIGLGSHHEKTSRFGGADRYVGITTVFSGDGRYLLDSRTRAVPFNEYGQAMLGAARAAIQQVREYFAWSDDDPVRLIFHAFKPVKDVEAAAMRSLVDELALPHAEFAFVHVADSHPFLVFDEAQSGEWAGRDQKKGIHAPPRGLIVKLSRRDGLLCLKGARELKQASDGHPEPLLLRLHRDSTFRDLTYVARQVFAFSCHSWRSFLPAPLPITILYSQLVARNLKLLSAVSGWSDDDIVGRIGRTQWFL